MAKYGFPYMGSKGAICDDLIKIFPNADNFYDLFGGGFSVTEAMLLRRAKHYKQFHFNEIDPNIIKLVKDAIAGKYNYNVFLPEFISREKFLAEKENDAYIKFIWSFGNNGRDYMFGKDIEADKRSFHNAVIFNDFDANATKLLNFSKFKDGYSTKERRLFLKNLALARSGELQQLERLQQLQQLERLQQLQQLERLEFYSGSYESIPIRPNSIIYCDPPYANTAEYSKGFDTNKFLDWANDLQHPVYISEYEIKDNRFKKVFSIKKQALLSAGSNRKKITENIYVNKYGFDKIILKIKS